MSSQILPIAETHFEGLRRALDIVAREKRYLAFAQAPAPEVAYAFYRHLVANDLCHHVALIDDEVVGWCDVLPVHGETRAHVGTLGIGLVPAARHRGLGRALMQATLDKARAKGLTRVELAVRVDNRNAKALYERMGFRDEGLSRCAFRVDGQCVDAFTMALLW